MSYVEHKLVQDKGIPEVASGLVSKNLPVLGMFSTFAPDKYFGQEGGVITEKVPGALPSRKYEWRNDRKQPIKVDRLEETTVTMTVTSPENHYSSVELTDEQKEYDLGGSFGDLTLRQTTAIINTLNREARDQIINAPYELGIAVDVTDATAKAQRELGRDVWYNGFIQARRELNAMGVPQLGRSALAGSQVAAELIMNAKLDKIQGNNTPHVFADATIGSYAGFNVIEDTTGLVNEDEVFFFDSSGFLFWSFAPAIPEGATRGARTNQDGVGLRWIVDYDPGYQIERSTWNSWNAFGLAQDRVQGVDTDGNDVVGLDHYFVKGVKATFKDGVTGAFAPGDGGDDSNGRKGAAPGSELARYRANEPLRAARSHTGAWYPSILRGDIGIGGEVIEPPLGE